MWALYDLWRKRIRRGIGGLLRHSILLYLKVGMKDFL
jgi:hypothetical protein